MERYEIILCGTKVESLTIGFGILNYITSGLTIAICFVALCGGWELSSFIPEIQSDTDMKATMNSLGPFFGIASAFISIFFAYYLIKGVRTQNLQCVRVYYIFSIILFVMSLATVITTLINSPKAVWSPVMSCVFNWAQAYVVWCTYRKLQSSDSEPFAHCRLEQC